MMQRPGGRHDGDASDLQGFAGAGANSNRQPPSPRDWDAVKDVVERLYCIEELPLREVKEYLEQQYGFRASERMFKDRLKKWRFHKNLTRENWVALAVLQSSRRALALAQGKRSTLTVFSVRGHRKTVRDLQKYSRSQGMTDEELAANAPADIVIPDYIRALTPEEEEAPRSSPSEDSYPESPTKLASPSGVAYVRPEAALLLLSGSHDHASPLSGTSIVHPSYISPISSASASIAMTNSTLATSIAQDDAINYTWADDTMEDSTTLEMTDPTSGCNQLQQDIEMIGYQIVQPAPLLSRHGYDDIGSWILVNATHGADPDEIDCSCARCHQPSSMHFASLDSLVPENLPRSILNGSQDQTLQIPASTKEEGAWKWVALCFLSCMKLRSGLHELSLKLLLDASAEFERLLSRRDQMLLTAANQMISILAMHDQGDIATKIMRSAQIVTERKLAPSHPVRVTIDYLTASAGLKLRDSEIRSHTLRDVHDQLNAEYGTLHPYTITAFYNYSWMLKWEKHYALAESNLRQVHKTSCSIFGRHHMQSLTALGTLAGAQIEQGNLADAIENLKILIQDSRQTLGRSHPYRLEGKRRLALQYEKLGQKEKMVSLYWDVLEGRARMLGKKHPYTAGARQAYESLMKELGRWEEGGNMQREVDELFIAKGKEIDGATSRSRSGSDASNPSQCEAF